MTTGLPELDESSDTGYSESPEVSPRSRSVALVLGILGGVFGLHRFYAGRTQSGIFMALTLGGMGIWWLYDMVMLVAGEFPDAEGLRVRNWQVVEMPVGASGAGAEAVRQLGAQVEMLQQQLGELAERVDFAERLLTQQRERERLRG